MPKLIVFGDSFANDTRAGSGPTWMQLLAGNLSCSETVMLSHAGSSLNYSAHKLMQYLGSPRYAVDDIIVFVITSRSRSRLVHKDFDPSWASENLNFVLGNLRENHPSESFYKQYSEYFKFELEFFSAADSDVDRFKMAMTLKQLPNTVVVISAFDNLEFRVNPDMLADTHNFILINAGLWQISLGELIQGVDFKTFYNFFHGEVRNCHLSKTNNQVLAELLSTCIHNKSRDYFDRTKFKQNFIGLSQEYEPTYQEELGTGWLRYKEPPKPGHKWHPFTKK